MLIQEECNELAKLLHNCPEAKKNRELIIEQLPSEITRPLGTGSANFADFVRIVTRFNQLDGGIRKLIEVVRLFEGNDRWMQSVDEWMEKIWSKRFSTRNGGYLPFEIYAEFESILVQAGINESDLQQTFQETFPDYCDRQSPQEPDSFKALVERQDILRIYNKIANITPMFGEPHPIEQFATNIFKKLDSGKDVLSRWIEKLPQYLKNVDSKSDKPVQVPYLMVDIEQVADTGTYQLTVWYWNKHDKEPEKLYPQIRADEQDPPHELGLVKDKLRILVQDAEIQADTTWVDFIVPLSLFSEPVDQWKIDVRAWGQDYPLAIRTQERFGPFKRYKDRLRKRWNHFTTCCSFPDLVLEPENRPDQFYARFESESIACVAFTFSLFDSGIDGIKNDQEWIRALLVGGVPIAVWLRQNGSISWPVDKAKHHFSELFSIENSLDIRKRVQKERQENTDWGKSLVLYWDDPMHTPPKKFQAPQVRH